MQGPKIKGTEFLDDESPKVGSIADDLMGIEDEEPEEEVEENIPDDSGSSVECEFCKRMFKNGGGLALHQKIMHQYVKGIGKDVKRKEWEKRVLTEKVKIKPDGKKEWELNVQKTLPFDAELLAVAQMMLNEGVASDFQSLIKKALYGMAHRSGYPQAGGETMNKQDEMGDFMEKLQNQKMKKELLSEFNKGEQSEEIDMNRIIKIMEQKYKMEMLQGMTGGGGMDMNKMMMNMFMSQMMKSMMEPKAVGPSPEVIGLQSQFQILQQQLLEAKQEARDAKFDQILKASTESKQDQKGAFTDFILAQKRIEEEYKSKVREVENVLADRDEEMRTKEQDQFKKEIKDEIEKLSKKNIGSWGETFQQKVQEKILNKLDLDKLMDEKKESGWEKVRDIVGTVVREAGPILQPMVQAHLAKRAQPMVTPEQLQAMQFERQWRENQMKPQPAKEEPKGTPTPTGIIPEATDKDWEEGEELEE